MSTTIKRPGVVADGVGASPARADGGLKTTGQFAYASDLWADGMLWGVTVRSPHAYARIRSIDVGPALAAPGVRAVLTHEDVPGRKTYGIKRADQPVLAWDVVRYQGEPVAIVAADSQEAARRAAALVVVDYEPLSPLVDPELALDPSAPQLHEAGNLTARVHVRHGDAAAARERAEVVVSGEYELGMQDQAFLGPESGLAIPAVDGGVELYVATQNLYFDLEQMSASLALGPEKIRLAVAGVGGAFGGREDLSIHIHACMLALRTNAPVKMVYTREESFFGHVHRHPGRLTYEHGATRDGRLVYVKARILLDGGPYTSSSPSVCVNAASTAAGPYVCDDADLVCEVVFTNNPPCGAMRGFGAVQTCFGYEAQMDKLAAALGIDGLELRRRNALRSGSTIPTGQTLDQPVPVVELLDELEAMPLPPEPSPGEERDLRECPGGVSNATHGEGVRRGVGYAIGFKNVGFSGGFDDYSTARVRMSVAGGEPLVEVHTSAAEVGQGGVTVQAQIARTELGVERVVVMPADTRVGDSGSTSASRQTWLTGGAVQAACVAVREALFARAAARLRVSASELSLQDGAVVSQDGEARIPVIDVIGGHSLDETRVYRPRRTTPLDENGQGDAHLAFSFAAHRAVVDVDVELGLVRVVELACAQDVGKALNPGSVEGQIEGASSQGLGFALMEEIEVRDGIVRNPSFTDYLIPTMLDMPPVPTRILELAQPGSPYGLNGMAEAPSVSSTAAVAAALRAASGCPVQRVPARPQELIR